MKQRIVILSAFLSPFRSGAEACAEEVARELKDRFDIVIVTARLRRDLPRTAVLPTGVPMIRVGIGASVDKWLFPFLAPFAARKLRPKVIHAILESYAGLALVFCAVVCRKSRRILTCQSTNTQLLLRLQHSMADQVTAISSVLVDRARTLGRSDVSKIPNGVHMGLVEQLRRVETRVPGRILFAGRLEHVKGVDTLLDAFALIEEHFPTAHLRIVGDGSQRAALKARHPLLTESGRVTFVGALPPAGVQREMLQAEIFCGLSRSEALGNVFLEAQACGCAVIASNTGGIPDIVLDEQTGLLVQPDHKQIAAAALERLLKDATLRAALSQAAMHHAQAFDWSVIAGRYGVLYEQLAQLTR